MEWFGFDGGASLRALLAMIGSTEIQPLLARYLETIGERSPTACTAAAYPAMPHGSTFDQLRAFSYTMAFNLTGWPAAVVRCGTSPQGLPIGVQIVARPWREDIVLALAQHLERAMCGYVRPPEPTAR
jgi:Asp-tRNA(Asn)/Glu-tRNA(Gln) amidotransferase A subunit family amidase